MREFSTGATRDTDDGKVDYQCILSIPVLRAFGEYMKKHRVQADGKMRPYDNWKKGIPRKVYRQSKWRHLLDWDEAIDAGDFDKYVEAACAELFNIQGHLHESLKARDCTDEVDEEIVRD